MTSLAENWEAIWNYKLSLAPVLITYALFDAPSLFRRLTKIAYVPIYFIFFPSGHSDQLYAQYFNEDYMYHVGEAMSEHDKHTLRLRLQANAVFSMIFAALLSPWLCGLVSALYLTELQFFEFLAFLVVVKSLILARVLYKLRTESAAARNAFSSACAMYALYLALVAMNLTKSFQWTSEKLHGSGISGVLRGILEHGYTDIFINVIVVGGATWAISVLFANPANILRTDNTPE